MSVRVAHVINEPFRLASANGVQQVVYCLAHAQAELGGPVAVLSREDGVHLLGRSEETRHTPGIHCRRTGSIRHRLLSRYADEALAEGVLAWRPDIVHFHSIHIPRNVALAAHLVRSGIPYCVTTHGGLFPAALERGRLKKAVFGRLFERRYLNESRFVHAVSPGESDVIRRYGVERPVVVVPNGLPPDARARVSRPDALYEGRPWLRDRQVFMFVGRLDPWQKGLDLLIEGFARAGRRDAALVLVGPDCRNSRRILAIRADRFGVLRDVVFTGPAFGHDRTNLLAAADIFVHPSRWEGLSLSVLAAAAAGKPCLITREADPLGALERADAAFIVDASGTSIAAGLTRAATMDAEELSLMGARAQQVADAQFSWSSIAGRLIETYQEALGRVGDGRSRASGAHGGVSAAELLKIR
jgi:glycosyltransferase involved in cell wall biosynthesis